MSIPSMAYTVNGVELVPVEITNEMVKAMYDNGDVIVSVDFQPSIAMSYNLYNMSTQTKSTPSMQAQGLYRPYFFTYAFIDSSDILSFASDFAWAQRAENGNLNVNYWFEMPFDYYLGDDTQFSCYTYYSGSSVGNSPVFHLKLFDDDNNYISNIAKTSYRSEVFWNFYQRTRLWQSNYNWVPEGYNMTNSTDTQGIRSCMSLVTFNNIATSEPVKRFAVEFDVSEVRASGSGTGYSYFFCAPGIVSFNFNMTVYVEKSFEDAVLEYLDIITGPTTPTQQARINELKDKFDDTLDDLDGAKDNIHKDMPDLPSVSDLPEEALDGMEDASEYVINPFLSIGIVSTLLAVTFIFTVIKILLYGSGPY